MIILPFVLSAVAGYLIGSMAFSVWIARARGVNIFDVGSGNPGATNVLRSLGRGPGYLCFLLDALKGALAVACGFYFGQLGNGYGEAVAITALLFAILGHSFSVFIGFRGGKGVATTVGGLCALLPMVFLIAAVVWLAVFFLSRYVSLASLALGVSLPIAALLTGQSGLAVGLCLVLAVLITVRHRSNIRRLMAGTENRMERKRNH